MDCYLKSEQLFFIQTDCQDHKFHDNISQKNVRSCLHSVISLIIMRLVDYKDGGGVQLPCISFDKFDDDIIESYCVRVSLTKSSVFYPHIMLGSKN